VNRPITITVFGSGTAEPGSETYEQARQLGEAISRQGWTLCNGGYGGTMEAAAMGAKQAGGKVIGVTCEIFGRTAGPNRYIDEEIKTPNLLARLDKLVELGDAYVVLPGGTGTLLELAYVWELTNKRLTARKPIVLLGDWWRDVIAVCARDNAAAPGFTHIAESPEAAIAHIQGQATRA
jgi:uncharacterized protein (TIGR00730 family)